MSHTLLPKLQASHHETTPSDTDSIDDESLALSSEKKLRHSTTQPQFVSSRTKKGSRGLGESSLMFTDGNTGREDETTTLLACGVHVVLLRPDCQVKCFSGGRGAPLRRTPRPMLVQGEIEKLSEALWRTACCMYICPPPATTAVSKTFGKRWPYTATIVYTGIRYV